MSNNQIEQMLTQLIQMQAVNNTKLEELASDVTEIKADVAELKADVTVLKADVAEMKGTISTMKTDIKEIKEGQERQDRILEMLSVKSIETDSYIRDFKRRF